MMTSEDKVICDSRRMAAQVPNGGTPVKSYCRYCKHRRKHKCRLHGGKIRNAICNQFAVIMKQQQQ